MSGDEYGTPLILRGLIHLPGAATASKVDACLRFARGVIGQHLFHRRRVATHNLSEHDMLLIYNKAYMGHFSLVVKRHYYAHLDDPAPPRPLVNDIHQNSCSNLFHTRDDMRSRAMSSSSRTPTAAERRNASPNPR